MILDFKTDRLIPDIDHQISFQYLAQLAVYRELVRQIYPDKMIVSALLWTRIPKLQPVADDLLDQAMRAIKQA